MKSLALLDEPGIAQDAADLLGRNRQPLSNARNLFPFSCPDLRYDDLCKFLGDLLKALVADHSLRPGAQGLVNTRGAQDVRLQSDELFPKMIPIVGTQQCCGLGRALLRLIPLLKEVVRSGHSAHDVSARQQAAVLRVLG